jgi:hypothetical protein
LKWLWVDAAAIYTIIILVLKVVIIFSPVIGRVFPHRPAAFPHPAVALRRPAVLGVWAASLPAAGGGGDYSDNNPNSTGRHNEH